MTVAVALLTAPDGNKACGLVAAYIGPLEDGEKAVRPIKAFGNPVMDIIGPIPYVGQQSLLEQAMPPGFLNYHKADFVKDVSAGLIDAMVDGFSRVPSPQSSALLFPIHGAASRVAPDATAFPHRKGLHAGVYSLWTNPAENATHIGWVRQMLDQMQPFVENVVYVNELGEDDTPRPRGLRCELRPPGVHQGEVRSGERLPTQREHQARRHRPARARVSHGHLALRTPAHLRTRAPAHFQALPARSMPRWQPLVTTGLKRLTLSRHNERSSALIELQGPRQRSDPLSRLIGIFGTALSLHVGPGDAAANAEGLLATMAGTERAGPGKRGQASDRVEPDEERRVVDRDSRPWLFVADRLG